MVSMNMTTSSFEALNTMSPGPGMVVVVMIVLAVMIGVMVWSLFKWGRWALKGAGLLASFTAVVGVGVGISFVALTFLRDRAQEIVYEQNYTLPYGLAACAVLLTVTILLGRWVETSDSKPAKWIRKAVESGLSPSERDTCEAHIISERRTEETHQTKKED